MQGARSNMPGLPPAGSAPAVACHISHMPLLGTGVWRRCCDASSRRELKSWWPGVADGNQCNMCAVQMACAWWSAPKYWAVAGNFAAEAAARQLHALDELLPCSCAGWLPMFPMATAASRFCRPASLASQCCPPCLLAAIPLCTRSHNQQSIEQAVQKMSRLGMPPSSGVYFGQLLGERDSSHFVSLRSRVMGYRAGPFRAGIASIAELVLFILQAWQTT